SLSPEEQQRAWENYQRYRDMPNGRQKMIDRRYQQFQQMPPEQQQRLRQNYEAYRGQRPDQRRQFTEKYRPCKKTAKRCPPSARVAGHARLRAEADDLRIVRRVRILVERGALRRVADARVEQPAERPGGRESLRDAVPLLGLGDVAR